MVGFSRFVPVMDINGADAARSPGTGEHREHHLDALADADAPVSEVDDPGRRVRARRGGDVVQPHHPQDLVPRS